MLHQNFPFLKKFIDSVNNIFGNLLIILISNTNPQENTSEFETIRTVDYNFGSWVI